MGRMRNSSLLVAAAAFAIQGCDVGGAWEHVYSKPVLRLTQVAGGGGTLDVVQIADVVINGRAIVELSALLASPAVNMALVNGRLECQVACGFGVDEGGTSSRFGLLGIRKDKCRCPLGIQMPRGGVPRGASGARQCL